MSSEGVKRWSIECKAPVKLGEFSRGGVTRGDNRASDHDMGCKEKYIPCGIVDEESAALHITFGSSYKTSDFIVDLRNRLSTVPTSQRGGVALARQARASASAPG